MSLTVVLDTGPLGILTNPRRSPETVAALIWAVAMIRAGHRFIVPAIADYEVRRELERAAKRAGLAALDTWNGAAPNRYLPLSDSALRLGATLWARPQRRDHHRRPEGTRRRRSDRGAGARYETPALGFHRSDSERRASLLVCPRRSLDEHHTVMSLDSQTLPIIIQRTLVMIAKLAPDYLTDASAALRVPDPFAFESEHVAVRRVGQCQHIE